MHHVPHLMSTDSTHYNTKQVIYSLIESPDKLLTTLRANTNHTKYKNHINIDTTLLHCLGDIVKSHATDSLSDIVKSHIVELDRLKYVEPLKNCFY